MSFESMCPFRNKTAMRVIYLVIARSKSALKMHEIVKRARLPEQKVKTLVAAMTNVFHNSQLRKIGVAVARDKKGYLLRRCKADLNAVRPERGSGKAKKGGNKKNTSKPIAPFAASKQPPAQITVVEGQDWTALAQGQK
jgi:hypothetical protein